MADEPTTTTTPAPTTDKESSTEPQERTVPYDRFKEKNDAAKAAIAERDELKQRIEELEDRDKSETERERKAREKAEARVTELEGNLTKFQRSQLIRDAAHAEGFEDPGDAVVFLSDKEIEDETAAKKAVKELGKAKPKLLKGEGDTPPPEIGRVLKDGEPVAKDDKTAVERSAREQEAGAVMDAIKSLKQPAT